MKTKSKLTPDQLQYLMGLVDDFFNKKHPFKQHIRAARFFSAGIFYQIDEITKKVEVLLCEYKEDGVGPLEIRFPGGSSELGENPYEVLMREIKEETGLIPMSYEPIFHAENRDSDDEKSDFEKHHHKFFFAIDRWAGCMKKKSDLEMGEVKGFLWKDLRDAKKILHKRHGDAFDAFCEHIAKKYPTREIHEQLPGYGY